MVNFIKLKVFFIIPILLFCGISSDIFSQNGKIFGTVSDEFGPLPGAKVELIGRSKTSSCDAKGNFSFDVEPGIYRVKADFIMYKPKVTEVTITFINLESELTFVLESGNVMRQNITIGSRSDPRSQLETSVAIDIISSKELNSTPHTSLAQKLQYLVPSFNSNPQTISDGTDHVDPSSLRGLGPDQVLILINGKRRHSSALLNVNGTVGRGSVGTDLNAIPISAIDRIEILRDGAAAQYGSDAIAGVINIILKDETNTGNFNFTVTPTLAGDGMETQLNSNHGFEVGNTGFINLSSVYRLKEEVNRSGDYTGNVYSNNDSLDNILIADNDFFSKNDFSGNRVMAIGGAKTLDLGIFMNSVIPLKKDVEFYSNGGMNFRNGKAHGFYRFPKDENKVVLELYPHGFSPIIQTDISDKSILAGVRSKDENGWNIDFSSSFGISDFNFNVLNSNNASMGTATPTNFNAGGFQYSQNIVNLDISKYLDSIWIIKGINFAFGGDMRIENYKMFAGEEASWIDGEDTTSYGAAKDPGAQLFPGFRPQNELDKNRTKYANYVDIESNLSEKWLLGTAARYENYSDFGSNLSWKVASRYKVSNKITVRSAYSTGFRAPSLHQVYFNNIGTQFIGGEAFQVGTFNNESNIAKAFGVGALKAETSKNLSAGITGELLNDLTITIDGYRIDIKDRIVLSGRFDKGFEQILSPLGAGAAQFFTNSLDSKTTGMDIVLGYNKKLGRGLFKFNAAMSQYETKVVGPIKTSDELTGQEDVLVNREEISRIEVAQPSNKLILMVNYKIKNLTFTLRNTRFGSVQYVHPSDGDEANWVMNEITNNIESRDQTFRAKWITDINVMLQINDNINLALGSANLLNVFPDKHKHSSNISDGRFIYSRRVQQFGVLGATYFMRLNIRL